MQWKRKHGQPISPFALSANQCKGVKWLLDTGCGHDLIGKSKAASLGVDIVQDKDEIVFQTAHGPTSTSDSIKYYVNELKETVQPFVLDETLYWSTMHAHDREQDNHRFFVPYRIAVRNHLRPADPKANITFRFVNHNGTVLGLPGHGLATGTEVTLVALDPNKPTVVMACSESHNWFTALAQRWHVQVVTITLQDDLLSQYGENLAKHAITKSNDMLCFSGPCTGG